MAPKRRRGKAYLSAIGTLSKSDKPINTELARRSVDNPHGAGSVRAISTLRDDPLGALYFYKKISQSQFEAGRKLENHFEVLRARFEFGDHKAEVGRKINKARLALPPQTFRLLESILDHRTPLNATGWNIDQAELAIAAGLQKLSHIFGLQSQAQSRYTPPDKYSQQAAALRAKQAPVSVAEAA